MPMAESYVAFLTKTIVFTILVSSIQCNNADAASLKVKRGANMGLIPFPRVGRSGSYARIPGSGYDAFDATDVLHEIKRQNLMAFPRVGRDNWRPSAAAAADNGARNGLWWGPRLGRVEKRGIELSDAPWALISLREYHLPTSRDTDFTPRLGRESEEELENDGVIVTANSEVAEPRVEHSTTN